MTNLILVFRAEMICLAILVFLFFTSQLYQMGKDHDCFFRICLYAIGHVVFDFITVYTVNHTETVPYGLNWFLHVCFYLCAIMFTIELLNYIVSLVYDKESCIRIRRLILWVPAIYLLVLPFLPMEILQGKGTKYSYGVAAVVGYAIAFLFLLASVMVMLFKYSLLDNHIRKALVPVLVTMIVIEVIQIIIPELLFTGGCVTLATVAVFFALENPVYVMQRKALMDALTGVKSRNAYELDIVGMKADYAQGKYDRTPVGLVFCDLNGLKQVNDRLGHIVGDEYIGIVAQALMKNMKSVRNIYRMGGDEFLAVYVGASEEKIREDMEKVRGYCKEVSREYPFRVEVAMGFALSGRQYASLKDVLHAADHNMYKNKWEMKNEIEYTDESDPAMLDKTALDDRIFKAFSDTSDRNYLYLCNMETNVSRWSRSAVDYFGLPGEYMLDVKTIWEEYIHPEDRDAYRTDIENVFAGKKEYHDIEYRARNQEGKYVICTCRGKILKGEHGEPDLFAGTMVNHGIVDGIDPVTNLPNAQELMHYLERVRGENAKIAVLYIGIRSFGRINMLYGSAMGDKILRMFGKFLRDVSGAGGSVFRMDGAKFTLVLFQTDREYLLGIYETIKKYAEHELFLESVQVPMQIYGGAVIINQRNMNDQWIKSGLEYTLSQSRNEQHGNLVFWGDMVQADERKRIEMYMEINRSVVHGCRGFYLQYQPIMDAKTEKMAGMEALLRWRNPLYGEVPPGKFIPWIESDPCYLELGKWILRQAIQDTAPILKKYPHLHLNVNITAEQLLHREFIKEVRDILDETGFPGGALCLELTERCKNLDRELLREKIAMLRKNGIHVIIDDMGIGSASLGLMLELPVDVVKVDKSIIRNIQNKAANQLFVESIIRAGNELKIFTCLEGLETKEEYEYLKNLGATYYQGFYFAKPLDIGIIAEKIEKENRLQEK